MGYQCQPTNMFANLVSNVIAAKNDDGEGGDGNNTDGDKEEKPMNPMIAAIGGAIGGAIGILILMKVGKKMFGSSPSKQMVNEVKDGVEMKTQHIHVGQVGVEVPGSHVRNPSYGVPAPAGYASPVTPTGAPGGVPMKF